MSLSTDELYKLLPAIHRIRDEERGRPLWELIQVIAAQATVLQDDIRRLYENLFIETCDEWVVPYIGDLLSVRGLYDLPEVEGFSRRALVANTLRYRRRKGTATVLEQLAFDTTGWRARAVEFFQLTEWTQNDDHVRLQSPRTPDFRDTDQLELIETAFDRGAHTVDVRHIDNGRGRHNVPSVGLYLWRLQAYPVTRGSARPVSGQPGAYAFSPLGIDTPLFNLPQAESEITHLAQEINVPGMLRRRPPYEELEARRSGGTGEWFKGDDPVLAVFLEGAEEPLELNKLQICHLGSWKRPPAGGNIAVAVDPVLGRLTIREDDSYDDVRVSYQYGFSGDLGGGPYNRRESVKESLPDKIDWQVGVRRSEPDLGNNIYSSIDEALTEWDAQTEAKVGVIAIMDSDSYGDGTAVSVTVPAGKKLFIVAADWPEKQVATGGNTREVGELSPTGLRPHLRGGFEVTAEPPTAASDAPGELAIDGLLIEGIIHVADGDLGRLRFAHSTQVPASGDLWVHGNNDDLTFEAVRSICGPVTCEAADATLTFLESIIDNGVAPTKASERLATPAIQAGTTGVELDSVTVFGHVSVETLNASNCLFVADKVEAVRRQEGCVRYSYLPPDSTVPRQYRCQPAMEEEAQIRAAEASLTAGEKTALRSQVRKWLVPAFTSQHYGDPAYAQLHGGSPGQIFEGADDGSEMGAFSILKQPQRITNLKESLDEYLRFGLEAGILFVT